MFRGWGVGVFLVLAKIWDYNHLIKPRNYCNLQKYSPVKFPPLLLFTPFFCFLTFSHYIKLYINLTFYTQDIKGNFICNFSVPWQSLTSEYTFKKFPTIEEHTFRNITSCVLSPFILSPHYPGFSFLFCSPLLWMGSGKCWVWRDFLAHWGKEEFSHPKECCLLLFLTPFWIIESNPCFSISTFSTQDKWKKSNYKPCPQPKAPFSRHVDKLHPGYLTINLWFLWEIVRHVMYSRYKKAQLLPLSEVS